MPPPLEGIAPMALEPLLGRSILGHRLVLAPLG
jgi:hypothetical protein